MIRISLALAATLFAATAAQAEDTPSEDLRVRIGIGAKAVPTFLGGDGHKIAPLWDVDVARGDKPFAFEAPDDKFAVPVFTRGTFSFGPTANLEFKRKPSDVGVAVDKVPTTFEAGAYAQWQPIETVRVRGDLRKGIGGHEGVVGQLSIDRIWRDGDKYVVSLGPRIGFSDGRYQRAYFGVDGDASIASGLPTYRPDGGLHMVGVATGLSYQFNPRFGLFGFARAERLVGDAAKSPIVREYGKRNQLSAGLGLSYTFGVAR